MNSPVQKRKLVGTSEDTARLFGEMSRVAPSRAPVLIVGETGTGKELVARTLYDLAPRGNFVTIDCSGLAGSLLESELFGYVRGAFTGAAESKQGLLALADGGTAFFDEVGELPLELQAKLLRALQEKQYRPVGAVHQAHSDFRIVAATNRDLALEVERGAFRRDLYYRLNVVTLRVPSLAQRPGDIPSLARHFAALHGAGHSITADAIDILSHYPWPGNVRELENCIRQMIFASSTGMLDAACLPPHILEARGASLPEPAQGHPITRLDELERRAIQRAMEHTNGDRSAAARMLGIGRTTLYRRLKAGA